MAKFIPDAIAAGTCLEADARMRRSGAASRWRVLASQELSLLATTLPRCRLGVVNKL